MVFSVRGTLGCTSRVETIRIGNGISGVDTTTIFDHEVVGITIHAHISPWNRQIFHSAAVEQPDYVLCSNQDLEPVGLPRKVGALYELGWQMIGTARVKHGTTIYRQNNGT
jgi:hypothetical protein